MVDKTCNPVHVDCNDDWLSIFLPYTSIGKNDLLNLPLFLTDFQEKSALFLHFWGIDELVINSRESLKKESSLIFFSSQDTFCVARESMPLILSLDNDTF